MNIIVVGSKEQANLIEEKINSEHTIILAEELFESHLEMADVVFDFFNEENPDYLEQYLEYPELIVFLNAVTFSLAEHVLFEEEVPYGLFGFNGHPTFIERALMEVSIYQEEEKPVLVKALETLGIEFQLVDDRVGMVTPRIIAMIINEAFYTVMEGTATRKDIDLGMKLGTNYPMGPFEWADKWGIKNVYEVLEALFDDTKEERYKICPLLKKEYLRAIM